MPDKIERGKLDEITLHERNANKGTQRGRGMVERSLRELGAGRSVLLDRNKKAIAGNHVTEVAAEVGLDSVIYVHTTGNELVAVVRDDLDLDSDPRAVRLAVVDNRSSEVGLEWDTDVLADLQDEGALEGLFYEDELAALLASVEEPQAGAGGDEFDTTPADGPTRVQPGDVWRIGPHRLMCCDSTNPQHVERLMAGERAQAVVTDVPYGISQHSNGLRRLDYGEWDKGDCLAVAKDALSLCLQVPTITAFCGDEQLSYLLEAMGDRTKRTIAWVKPNPTVLNGEHVFLPAVELAAHGRKAGAWFGGKCVRSIWEGAGPQDREHPNQKPLDLLIWLCDLTCAKSGVVYDPFLGSGTTLIAANRTGRKCYGMELEPKYCDVILRRAEAEGIGPIELVGNDG